MIWLHALHKHGPLGSSNLLDFAKSLGMNEKRGRERLGDLFHENNTTHGGAYLARPRQQFQIIDSRYNQLVYDLAPSGVRALREKSAWCDRSGPNGGPWWHRFMVSSITGAFDLGTADRTDVSFIPQSKILERASSSLQCFVEYADPGSTSTITRSLKPDALFGLRYHTEAGCRFRFFAVEADRGTEPLSTSSKTRKSLRRCVLQYRSLLVHRAYREQFKLTAPMLVLFVTMSSRRAEAIANIVMESCPELAPAILLRVWKERAALRKPIGASTTFFSLPWQSAAGNQFRLDMP